MREMTGPAGAFYSAEDADSIPPEHAADPAAHKMEGAFYLWRSQELDVLLGEAAPIVRRRYGIEPDGNAPVDPQQEFVGKNLLYIARSIDDLAGEFGRSEDEIIDVLNGSRLRLYQARVARPRPHLDDKVLTSWNGLMIGAFARAARVIRAQVDDGRRLSEPYLAAAQRAARFLRDEMWNGDTRTLLRRYRDGEAAIDGYAEDYAYLVFGLLELFQADPRAEWLEWAIALQRRQDELFWDEDNGGWFSTTGKDPTVLLRMKEEYDGAEPSPNSISVMNLTVLSHLRDEPVWNERIERTLRLFSGQLQHSGRAVPMMAAAYAAFVAGLEQVVIVGEGPAAEALANRADAGYRPFTMSIRLTPDQQHTLAAVAPLVAAMHPVGQSPAAYVCRDFACRAPVTTVEALEQELAPR
jgi:uncharacterized protein YyaL (SSP411 family)